VERKQFTFYRSFAQAVERIQDEKSQLQALWAIINFALNGEPPDLDQLSEGAAIVMTIVTPVLESACKKAESGQKGGSVKQTASKNKNKNKDKDKDKDKNKIKIKNNSSMPAQGDEKENDFDVFWNAYPKKVGKAAALEAFAEVDVPVETLVRAVNQQMRSTQWKKDGGQFIPNPARWLRQQGWEDQLPTGETLHRGARGVLGKTELENIRMIMEQ